MALGRDLHLRLIGRRRLSSQPTPAAERYAGGDYPFQGVAGDGLTAYASPAENADGKDVVVWYTPAFTHVPHVEDYPVMTTESAHFRIEPDGFFDSNPALDAPGQ